MISITWADGSGDIVPNDENDPRVQLVLYGSPEHGIAPLDVLDSDVEIFRAEAIKEVDEWEVNMFHAPINVAGREYPCSMMGQSRIASAAFDAEIEARLSEKPPVRRVPLRNGEMAVLTGDQARMVWRELRARNWGDAERNVEGVVHKAARIRKAIKDAPNADEIGKLLGAL